MQLGHGREFQRAAGLGDAGAAGSGNEQIFGADNGDWAAAFGFSCDPFGKEQDRVRAAASAFSTTGRSTTSGRTCATTIIVAASVYSVTSGSTNYLQPIASVLPSYANQPRGFGFSGHSR